ncbi:defensin [Striga asiatica]|uniref:Defensin n=1 Tax=Striga asiatica TaxID=4170 RepID=A0A5A7Q525_STRAF|nr:defensin [Striga asiatica]
MEKKIHGIVLLLTLLLTHEIMILCEARMCHSKSKKFKGMCLWLSTNHMENCKTMCRQEAFMTGKCLRGSCLCVKKCGTSSGQPSNPPPKLNRPPPQGAKGADEGGNGDEEGGAIKIFMYELDADEIMILCDARMCHSRSKKYKGTCLWSNQRMNCKTMCRQEAFTTGSCSRGSCLCIKKCGTKGGRPSNPPPKLNPPPPQGAEGPDTGGNGDEEGGA